MFSLCCQPCVGVSIMDSGVISVKNVSQKWIFLHWRQWLEWRVLYKDVPYYILYILYLVGLESELRVLCKAGALPLKPHLQSIVLWLFWRWGLLNYLPGLASNHSPLDLGLPVARITGVSHWNLVFTEILIILKLK
jgi:hypothetical protein